MVSSGGTSGAHSTAMCDPPGVVTGRYGTIGQVYFLSEPYWPLNTTLFVSDFRGNDPRWVFHVLAALPPEYDVDKSAATGVNRNVLGALRVPRSPIGQQRAIAGRLDASAQKVERAILALEQQGQIDLLQERRQALITAAVTGEPEITGIAARAVSGTTAPSS